MMSLIYRHTSDIGLLQCKFSVLELIQTDAVKICRKCKPCNRGKKPRIFKLIKKKIRVLSYAVCI